MNRAIVVISLFIAGMTQVSAQSVEDKRPASVSGTVLRDGTTEPLRAAQVELVPSEIGTLGDYDYNPAIFNAVKSRVKPFMVTTDNRGVFSFAEVVPGQYRLSAVRDGYSRTEFLQRGANDRGAVVDVLPGARLTDLVISMRPASTISGTVVDENGVPAAYASVQALAVQYSPGGVRRLRVVQTVDVNDLGEFRLYWLSPGDYYVAVDFKEGGARHEIFGGAPQIRPNVPLPEVEYPTFYYPGTPDLSGAQTIHLTGSGEVPGINFRLRHTPLATLHGSVTNLPTGSIKPGSVQILLSPTVLADGVLSFSYRSDAQGKFKIAGIAPGSYLMRAVASAGNSSMYSSVVRIDVGSTDVENIGIPLSQGIAVRGRVQVEGSSGSLPFDTSLIIPRFNGPLGRGESFSGRISASGALTAEDGFPGKFQVSLMGLPEGYYLKQVLQGSKDVLESDVQLGGDNPPSVDLVLAKNTRTLGGTVLDLDNRPATGVVVVLVPAQFQSRADRYRRVVTDAQGQFRIAGTPPGKYTAFAFDEILGDAFYNPEFLRNYTGRGVDVTVKDISDSIANPKLISVQQ
jgi:hypothetical protein